MDIEKLIIFIVMLSVVFHTVLNLREKVFSKDMLYILGLVLLTSLGANKDNPDFSINRILIAIPLGFAGAIAIVYRKEILPEISESSLYIISIIYLYSLIINSSFYTSVFLTIIVLIPVCIVTFYLFTDRVAGRAEKLFLYFLNIMFLCVISFFNLKRLVLELSWRQNLVFDFSLATSIFFITGIMFYLLVYMLSLIWMLPIPSKEETNQEMKHRIHQQASLFTSKFKNIQAYPSIILISSILIILLMTLSIHFKMFPHSYTEAFLLVILILDSKTTPRH